MSAQPASGMPRRRVLGLIAAGMVAGVAVGAGPVAGKTARAAVEAPGIRIYKDPYCGCCGAWSKILQRAGFAVRVFDTDDMARVKKFAWVPEDLESCHTALVDRYFVEGHVPLPALRKLLAERPDIVGIAVPGMPQGSPGMPGDEKDPFDVIALGRDGRRSVYMSFR